MSEPRNGAEQHELTRAQQLDRDIDVARDGARLGRRLAAVLGGLAAGATGLAIVLHSGNPDLASDVLTAGGIGVSTALAINTGLRAVFDNQPAETLELQKALASPAQLNSSPLRASLCMDLQA